MKQRLLVVVLVGVMGVGCGGNGGDSSGPTMPDVVGMRLDVAKSDLERAGIKDEPEVLGGGTFGVLDESNWTVCEQLPAEGSTLKSAPRLMIERSCPGATTTTVTPDTTAAPPSSSAASTTAAPPSSTAAPTTEAPAATETLTVENNPDLAALLSGPDSCGDAEVFAGKYLGRTIEFDGNIANEAPSEGGLDFLVYSGNYSEVTAQGPAMKFVKGSRPETKLVDGDGAIGQGDNLRIAAVVDSFNEGGCILFLNPVSLRNR